MKIKNILTTLCLLLLFVAAARAQKNTLTVPDVSVAQGRSIDLPIQMENTADIVAVQFTLTVPNGVTLLPETAQLTDRSDGHSLTFKSMGANKYMAMAFSSSNKPFIGRSGKLLTVKLQQNGSNMKEGSSYPLTLSDVVIADKSGNNLVTAISSGRLTIMKLPDLEVTHVSSTSSQVVPGQSVTLKWQVANIGGIPTENGWSEQLFLEDAVGNSKLVGTTEYKEKLAAASTISRTADIVLPKELGIGDEAHFKVKVKPYSDTGEPSWLQANNEAVSSNTVSVRKLLYITPEQAQVEETAAQTLRFKLTRSGSTALAEDFSLSATADARVNVPSSISIPKGQSSIYFYAQIVANNKLDTDSLVSLEASGNDYTPCRATLTIIDDRRPSLTITSPQEDVTEGGTIVFHITAERTPKTDLTISLKSDAPSRFSIPSPIVLRAGEKSVDVTVEALEDDVPDVEKAVTFSVSAVGYEASTMLTTLVDNDLPNLQLQLTPSAVSEGEGPLAVAAVLKRLSNVDKKVTIVLSDDSEGSIYYGRKTIEMPAGVEQVTVNLGPIDNTIVDGERTVNITAAVYIASCSCNASVGTAGGSVTVPLVIYDNDGPTLTLISSQSVLKEGAEMSMIISRNTDTTEALSVQLSNDHPSLLEMPSEVTIPKGQSEVSFLIKSKANTTTGDDFTAIITAEATGFAKANAWFSVTDQNMPDAQITDIQVDSTKVYAGQSVKVRLVVKNTGLYTLPEHTKLNFYLSNSHTAVATAFLKDDLAVGDTAIITREVKMPSAVGTYRIYAAINENRDVKELNYNNNSSNVLSIQTISPYTFTLSVDNPLYKQEEKVTIKGRVQGLSVANKSIDVYVINNGYRHVISCTTDEEGQFTATYQPYSGQMGRFIVGACYPGEKVSDALATFDIYGIKRSSNTAISFETDLGDTYRSSFSLVNPGVLRLTGITTTIVSKPQGCEVKIQSPSVLSGGEQATVSYEVKPSNISPDNNWEKIELLTKTAEGVELPTTLYYYCRSLRGKLKASVVSINTTMIKGETRDYPFVIANIGKGETGKVSLSLPSWMKSATPIEMPSLSKDATAEVILRLTPTDDMQLNNPVTGRIGINCENGEGLSLPFTIEPVSTSMGTLTIDVCDEYTYNTKEAPHLAGANVVVKHPTTGAIIANGTTDDKGLFSTTIPEGYYAVTVTAAKHSSYSNNLLVDPGKDNKTIVNLSYQAISIDWRVDETTVEDQYDIKTDVKYETSVPVPVVVLSVPSSIDAGNLKEGESLIFYATLTNKGLITAQDAQLVLPTDFKTLTFEALSHAEPFSLAPQQSVQIPVKVTKVGSSVNANAMNGITTRQGHLDNDPCASQVGTLYYWDCGIDRKWHRYGVAMQVGTCNSKDPKTWYPPTNENGTVGGIGGGSGILWPGGLPSGGGISSPDYKGSSETPSPITKTEDKGCEPCQNKYMMELIDCGLQLIPIYKTLRQIVVCAMNLYDLSKTIQDPSSSKAEILISTTDAISSCIAAKHAGKGDKDKSRVQKRLETLNEIGAELAALQAKIQAGGESKEDALNPISMAETFVSLSTKLASLAGFDLDHLEDLFCPLKLLQPCDLDSVPATNAQRMIGRNATKQQYPSYIQEFQQGIAYGLADQLAELTIRHKFFDDVSWLSSPEEQLHDFMLVFTEKTKRINSLTSEDMDMLYNARPENVTKQEVDHLVARWKNAYNGQSDSNAIDLQAISGLYDMMQAIDSASVSRGYTGFDDMASQAYDKCLEKANEQQKSVCSSITLQFSQQMVMTRQAFRGTLTVFNGNETNAMKDVKLNLTVTDEDGNIAMSDKFQINAERLEGFTGNLSLDEGWQLEAQQTGVATVLFIPTKNAAPTVNKQYAFGGTLSYIDAFTGLEVTRSLTPITLTVKPSPNLNLTYFMQRDVLGDDPLTEEVEPSEEAEFSLLINNVGYGDATNVRMTTNQPQIVDNEKGLDIQFELMSSRLNGKDKTLAMGKSIATDFGDIPAGTTAYAQWMLKSSLLGHFTDYKVEANHVTSYGNEDLSLLGDVSIHELIRSIDVEKADTSIVAFLTNDIVDADDTPDMLYLSDGEVENVSVASQAIIEQVTPTEWRLTITPSSRGWNYGHISDPTYGMSLLKSVTRTQDGKTMSLRNFWQTDRTLRDGKDPLYENRIHFVADFASTSPLVYTLTFESMPELQLAVASIEGIPAEEEVASTPVENVKVVFNKYIDAKTFTSEDIRLTVQGKEQDASLIDIHTDDNKTFTLSLARLNAQAENGYYSLTVQTANIVDVDGYRGKTGKTIGWTMYKEGKVMLSVVTSPSNAGTVIYGETDNLISVKTDYGNVLTLKAKAKEGYDFTSWTLNGETLSTDTCLTYAVVGDVQLTANFTLRSHQVSVDEHLLGGYIDGPQTGIYTYGESLCFVAQPSTDYAFSHWMVDDSEYAATSDTLRLTVKADQHISAVFKQEVYQQKLTFRRGWNWISTYLTDTIPTYSVISNATSIVGPTTDVDSLLPATAYKVKVATSMGSYAKGHLFDLPRTFAMQEGLNYLGYPCQHVAQIDDVLTNAEEGDAVISKTGFATYADGRWQGTLSLLTPGEGYLYKSVAPKQITFNPTSEDATEDTEVATDHAVVDAYTYPDVMGVTAQVVAHGEQQATERFTIYAMVGNECRGVSTLKDGVYYLTIFGNKAEDLSFVIEDHETDKQLVANEQMMFEEDVKGTHVSPYVFNYDVVTSLVDWRIAEKGMTIYSIDGLLLHTNATLQTLKSLPKGIYIINGCKYVIR